MKDPAAPGAILSLFLLSKLFLGVTLVCPHLRRA